MTVMVAGLLGQGEAYGGGKALTEVARSPVNAGKFPFDVPLEGAADLPEMSDGLFGGEEAEPCQGGIGSGRRVAMADDDEIPVEPAGVVRGDIGEGVDHEVHFHT